MRIHLVTDGFSLGGGIEHIYQVVRGLGQGDRFRFTVFGEPGPAVARFKDLTHVDIRDTGFDARQVMADAPDLVHVHHLKPLVGLFKNPFKTYPVPIIFTAHGLHIHKYEFFGGPGARLRYLLRFWLEKRLFRRVDRVIAVSREDRDFIKEKYGVAGVTYLTNGIDIPAVVGGGGESKESLRKTLGVPLRELLFVTVARFNFQKGYDILMRAIAKLKAGLLKDGRDLAGAGRFVLVGDGEELEAMRRLSRELGVSEYILFMGARDDVYDILRAGDVFVLPSRWEGLPIVLLETGLLKIPVIASDTYGNREVVGEGSGVLFDNLDSGSLAEVLRRALDGGYPLEEYAGGLNRVVLKEYGIDRMLSGLGELYGAYAGVS